MAMGDLLCPRFSAQSLEPAAPDTRHPSGPAAERNRLWRQIWMGCPGIGWKRLQNLETNLGGLETAWAASPEDLQQTLQASRRLGARELEAVLRYRAQVGPQPLSNPITAEQRKRWRQARQLLPGDPALPRSLAELERPPMQVLWQGQGCLWANLREGDAIAVVGTRKPSRHGLQMARRLGRVLAQAGWPVLTGLAEGIDAAVHEGCLEAGGTPIAVIGTPLQRISPRHHATLQTHVAQRGLLISEWAEGTAVKAAHFSLRKRLLVALAKAVVLVECPLSSSALQSAQLAWESGVPLWVVPADAGRSSAAGSNRWLSLGATALLSPDDLIKTVGIGPLKPSRASKTQAEQLALTGREALLLAAIGAGASLEQLCRRLRQEPQQLSERLLKLELEGVIKSEPGLWWRPGAAGSL